MKFDKEKLHSLASMPDNELWSEVTRIASGFGYNLPKETPPHKDMEKMRSVMLADKINVSEALKLVNEYKKRGSL